MEERTLASLEFHKILKNLAKYAVNLKTKERITSLKPSRDKDEILVWQNSLEEAVGQVYRRGKPPVSRTADVTEFLSRVLIQSTLSIEELLEVASLLRIAKDLLRYYNQDENKSDLKLINQYFEILSPLESLEQRISKVIVGPNEIADNASRKLYEIRREIRNKQRKISQILDNIINSSENDKYLQEKIVTMRNGRYAIPVKAEYRQKFKGAILDKSSTGATIFIEPLSIIEINNDINELYSEEKKEIDKILKELSQEVSFYYDEIIENYNSLIELDFLFAKANYSIATGSTKVELSQDNSINLKQAKHPLIEKDKVVASDLILRPDTKSLVITGPNTGGKTVTLKTLGLLSLMFQAGLFLPVDHGSTTKLFSNVFADIGDEQSIEQNLSTFSAHMVNIVDILDKVDKDSLALFDEIGAGTDPVEGAALAISILEYLKERNGLTVATTHYAEIKEYALTENNVLNASVEFDLNTLRPTYRLIIGLPGKSNAFEIAHRLGLSKNIIDQSKKRIHKQHESLEDTLAVAQEELIKAKNYENDASELKENARKEFEKAKKARERLESQREKILEKARKEAAEIVSKTKKETDQIYKEINKLRSQSLGSIDNKKLEELRKEINNKEFKINSSKPKYDTSKKYKLEDFSIGDRVYIKSLDREADVIKIVPKEKKIEISSGTIRIKLKPTDLLKVKKKKQPNPKTTYSAPAQNKGKMETRLDLRGKTAEEARNLLESFINEAILLNQPKLEVIHGYGTGKVRKAVHDYLKKTNLVSSYRLGGPGEGGSGATIIEL